MRNKLQATLKQRGYSVTASRKAVFCALEANNPLTMNELVRLVAPDVNRASVYRTVALFEQLGIVQRLQLGWKYKLELSNDFQEHHHHLTCVSCGNVTPFHEPEAIQILLASIAARHDFNMQQHQIELTGTCRNCQVD